jgi:Methylamine utilisation protein MauE
LDYLSLGIRLLLVLTFAASAASKVRSRDAFAAFAGSLGALGLLPRAGLLPIAVALVAAEAAAAALLLPEATAVAGLALAGPASRS